MRKTRRSQKRRQQQWWQLKQQQHLSHSNLYLSHHRQWLLVVCTTVGFACVDSSKWFTCWLPRMVMDSSCRAHGFPRKCISLLGIGLKGSASLGTYVVYGCWPKCMVSCWAFSGEWRPQHLPVEQSHMADNTAVLLVTCLGQVSVWPALTWQMVYSKVWHSSAALSGVIVESQYRVIFVALIACCVDAKLKS